MRDTNGDSIADVRSVLIEGLNSPFGMALIGNDLYVANTDAVLRYPDATGDLNTPTHGTKVLELPGGPIDHHWDQKYYCQSGWQHALCHRRLRQ